MKYFITDKAFEAAKEELNKQHRERYEQDADVWEWYLSIEDEKVYLWFICSSGEQNREEVKISLK